METTFKHTDISKLINQYFKIEDYEGAKKLLHKEIKKTPSDHWLYAQLSISYYELFDYKTALEHVEKAINLSPDCPLALDYYATILFANNRTEEALSIWNKLLNLGIDEIAHGQCGEGIRFAKSLINDIQYMVGEVYVELNEKDKALNYYKLHLQNRQRGVFSNFTKRQVEKKIKNIEPVSVCKT